MAQFTEDDCKNLIKSYFSRPFESEQEDEIIGVVFETYGYDWDNLYKSLTKERLWDIYEESGIRDIEEGEQDLDDLDDYYDRDEY